MSDKTADSRLAVCISRIPDTVPREDLALLPSVDQPSSDVFVTLYKERRKQYFCVCIAVTRRGLLQRVLDFVKDNGGVAHLDTFHSFREAKRGRPVALPRVIAEPADSFNDLPYEVSPLDIPFELVVKTLEPEQQSSDADPELRLDVGPSEAGRSRTAEHVQPLPSSLSLAESRAQAAKRRAQRLEETARQAITRQRQLDRLRRQVYGMEPIGLDITQEDVSIEHFEDEDYEQATKHAYTCILAAECAQGEVRLAEEIAHYRSQFKPINRHRPSPQVIMQYTMIYAREGIEPSPFAPEELPDPYSRTFIDTGLLRWQLSKSLTPAEEKRCRQRILGHILSEQGIYIYNRNASFGVDDDKQAYLEISFQNQCEYLSCQQLELSWGQHPFELIFRSAPLPPSTTVLEMRHVLADADDTSTLIPYFEQTLGQYLILLSAWRLDEVLESRGKAETRTGTSVLALVEYKPNPGNKEYLYDRFDLPGWINTSKGILPLEVHGRADVCAYCTRKPNIEHLAYHFERDCPQLGHCDRCGKTGHTADSCRARGLRLRQ